ncbi:MAG: 3-deoxy-7-phosphoheptulonate synthase, partial [Patescibacteria group bacterium]
LLKIYEESFMVKENGKKYLTSCDIPWIGKRTNDPDGMHVEMLSDIENPVGVKIGPGDKPGKIAELTQKLNPNGEPGKLLFILRFGVDNLYQAPEILQFIKNHSHGALILCDPMHGNTVKTADGRKTREVPKIIDEIKAISKMCRDLGIRLHGLHLEASGRDDRVECVDSEGQSPNHTAVVDPELNNDQLAWVLEETRKCFSPE